MSNFLQKFNFPKIAKFGEYTSFVGWVKNSIFQKLPKIVTSVTNNLNKNSFLSTIKESTKFSLFL